MAGPLANRLEEPGTRGWLKIHNLRQAGERDRGRGREGRGVGQNGVVTGAGRRVDAFDVFFKISRSSTCKDYFHINVFFPHSKQLAKHQGLHR